MAGDDSLNPTKIRVCNESFRDFHMLFQILAAFANAVALTPTEGSPKNL